MTAVGAASRWPSGVVPGAIVIASTSSGFWLRARVRTLGPSEARVHFDEAEHWPQSWLPTLGGFGEREATVTPELVAALPDVPPTTLPRVGTPVLVLWDQKRFHAATLVLRTNARSGVVRHDEGDEETVTPERVLVRGAVEGGALVRAGAARVGEGASVVVERGQGWVSMVGSRGVYVRFPKASHGLWYPLAAVDPGGAARPPTRPTSRGELAVGARVSARWVDRAWYPGTIRALRDGSGNVHVTWDDGSESWVHPSRVVVTTPAGPSALQEQKTTVEGPERWGWECSVAVLVRTASGDWARGRALATRGGDAFVQVDRGGEKLWARGRDLAVPAGEGLLPSERTAVIVEGAAGESGSRMRYQTGRALGVIGDRLEVRLDEGGTTSAPATALFVRLPVPAPSTARAGVTVGAAVLVEQRPGEEVPGVVAAIRVGDGVARVEPKDGKARTVDLTRVRLAPPDPKAAAAPEPSPPPAPTPPPAEAGMGALTDPDAERAGELMRQVVERWNGDRGTYRDAVSSAARAHALEVDVGELTLEVHTEPPHVVVTITAAGRVERAAPVDGVSVRLANWLHARLVSRAQDAGVTQAEDRAWATDLLPTGVRRQVTRAGGALCLTVRSRQTPTASDVALWARAVHGRLFDRDA